MVRSETLLADAPEAVRRVQAALAAPSRMAVVRALMEAPRTFAALADLLPLSHAGVRAALADLAELGYVSDDSPAGRQRKSVEALFTVDREVVLRDLAELFVWVAR